MFNMFKRLLSLIYLEGRCYQKRQGVSLLPLLFLIMVISLFSISLDLTPDLRTWLMPGILWVGMTLSLLLSVDGLFREDFEVGILEQLLVSPRPLSLLIFAKLIAHWLVIALPLVLFSPFLVWILGLPASCLFPLFLSLLIGSLALCVMIGLGESLTLILARGGMLLAVLVLPLVLPVILLGVGSLMANLQGLSALPYIALLTAVLILALSTVPFAIGAALRVNVAVG